MMRVLVHFRHTVRIAALSHSIARRDRRRHAGVFDCGLTEIECAVPVPAWESR